MQASERQFRGNSRFKIVRVVGEGGMGTVFEAIDTERGVHVALKTLQALSAEGLLSFKREFREFQGIEHPNLVNLGELYSDGAHWFFTMELLQGRHFLEAVNGRTNSDSNGTESWSATRKLPVEADGKPSPPPFDMSGPIGPPPLFDDSVLRDRLRQLSRGLIALHDAGKVHRDIKPSNVLVTNETRVVLLDYGVAATAVATHGEYESTIVGTVAYMAPEQAAGLIVGPEADWYSTGVMLFEAMTGQLPIDGSPIVMMEEKQTRIAPLASSLNPAVAPDLDALCADLLNIDPARRPTGRQLLDRLGGRRSGPRDGMRHLTKMVGRKAELAALQAALATVEAGGSANVSIVAGSGLGKTVLVRQFTSALGKRPKLMVLSGACYEREAVPYNGFDGLIDSLSVHLGRLGLEQTALLLPHNGYLLTKAFPVLSNTEAFTGAVKPEVETPDPQELRRQLFAALRELLHRLTRFSTLVLYIDDLQWLGADSAALLTEVMRPPDAPRVLWLTTIRAETDAEVTSWQEQVPAMLGSQPVVLRLTRLDAQESVELARTLMGSKVSSLNDSQLESVARESGGHPLFIDELMRQAAGDGESGIRAATIDLDEAIWQRLGTLDEEARGVISMLTLAPGRMAQGTLAAATKVDPARWTKVLNVLRAAHLVRTHGMRASDQIEPYHDRIRISVRNHLPASAVKSLYQRLADTLELETQRDVEALTFYWAEAGEAERAAGYAIEAAEKANRALSFDRAAGFFQQAIDLRPNEPQPKVWAKLGEALVNAGRGAKAGDAFVHAARLEPSAQKLDLQRRAAEQFLRSGRIDLGIQLMSDVLKAVGIKTPATPQRALVSLLWQRARLMLRGFGFTIRTSVDASDEQKLAMTWSASNGFSMVDPLRAGNFQSQNLLLALKVGEPERLSGALSMEAAFIATSGESGREKAGNLVEQAESLAQGLPTENARALATLIRGVIAFQNGRWVEAHQWLSAAAPLLRTRCVGMTWERDSCDLFYFVNLFYLGRFTELREAVPRLIQDADARGDLYAGASARLTSCNVAFLASDQPALAKSHAELAISLWADRGYLAHSYYFLVAQVNRLLYEGNTAEAWQLVEDDWPKLKGSLFMRVEVIRVEANHLRARTAFAHGGEAVNSGRSSLRAIEAVNQPYASALALLLRASLAVHDGTNVPNIAGLLQQAQLKLTECGMAGYALAAKWAAAKLMNDSAGAAAALKEASALGAQSPERILRMLGLGKFTDEIERS